MRHEEEAIARQLFAEALVVQRGDDGLAGAGGRDDEVARVTAGALRREIFEDLLLVLLGRSTPAASTS
jgi:hypothetical protein